MGAIITALAALAAYLVGSLPAGLLLGQDQGVHRDDEREPREILASVGWRFALFSGCVDIIKGALPVLFSRFVLHLGPGSVALVGLATFLGHAFSIYLRFRGGRGVLLGCGVFLGIEPRAALIAVVIWGVLFAALRASALASIGAAVALPVAMLVLRAPAPASAVAGAIGALIIWRHRVVLVRLVMNEPRPRS